MLNDKIIKICDEKLIFFNFSENTRKIYTHYIKEFVSKQTKQIIHCNSNDFQTFIQNYNFSSTSQQNQVISSIKFLYEKVLKKSYGKVDFSRPNKEKSLPKVIDKQFLIENINSIENIKHRAILTLAYSTGMRVSEVVNLKIEHVDSKRMVINIIQGKGRKDRVVPLSVGVLDLLREYYKIYKPEEYMFNGQNSKKYSSTSCNQIVKKYLGKDYHMHMLRHSCFTTLLEFGVDLRIIQKIAGHSNVKTTEIYTHVSTNLLSKVPLPM